MKLISMGALICFVLTAMGTTGAPRGTQDTARKFDEFTGRNWESAMAHLDNFAANLQNEPTAHGLVFVYGGQSRRRGESNAWSSCLKDYLIRRRAVDATRVSFVQAGYRENLTAELWLSPPNQQTPSP